MVCRVYVARRVHISAESLFLNYILEGADLVGPCMYLWISVHFEHCSAAIRLLQQFNPISFLFISFQLLMYHFQLLVMTCSCCSKGTAIHSICGKHYPCLEMHFPWLFYTTVTDLTSSACVCGYVVNGTGVSATAAT